MRRLLLAAPLLGLGCVMYDDSYVIPGRDPVSSVEVLELRRNGASDDTILARIYSEGVNRKLNADDIIMLKQQGVSDAVIQAMLQAPITTPVEGRVVRSRRTYYNHDADNLFFFGLGWLFGRGHHGHWRH